MTEEWVLGRTPQGQSPEGRDTVRYRYDTRTKVNPPLRGEQDRQAVLAAVAEGLIDVIATDHAPHRTIDKECTYDEAAFGITGFETAFGALMQLVESNAIDLGTVIQRLTCDPCRIFGLPYGTLSVGSRGDVVVLDPGQTWQVDSNRFYSKGKNTPLDGHMLRGRVVMTLVEGQVVFE